MLPAAYLNAAHELRAPLARLLDQVDSLRDPANGTLSPGQQTIAQDIFTNCVRMQRLVEDCFSYGRMISGEISLTTQPTDIAELFNELASAWEPAFAKRNIQLNAVPLSGDLDGFVCDPYKLLRAVSVLLENALKFTPAGGKVDLSWDRHAWHGTSAAAEPGERPAAVEREPGGNGTALLVRVCDPGPGIAPEDQQHIFRPFVRLHRQRIRLDQTPRTGDFKYQRRRDDHAPGLGLGLGLAVAWRLVQLHGGLMWVDSEPGQGSTFSILIPPAAEAAMATAS